VNGQVQEVRIVGGTVFLCLLLLWIGCNVSQIASDVHKMNPNPSVPLEGEQ